MLGVIIIPAVLLLIGVIFLPDSPRWFAAKRRFVDAERVLLRLRDTSAEANASSMKSVESLKVNSPAGRCLKTTALPPRGVPRHPAAGDATVHRDERHHVLRAEDL
ncbi:Arabinose-proton symporter [Klebsiella pneumoniae]|uniref:Arabinose-proton symporter n=1 Tax=Klebsiella pneumoniae TaxID=573 RepID=A0A4P0YG88_KLEPN|nr:Arabinose-proton symporter [Klebsiella pneumoniae]